MNIEILAEKGTPLRDLLFEQGVEFPCGGSGRCRGCRVRVVQGDAPVTPLMADRLTVDEIAQGWRLACQMDATSDLTIELRQWEAAILSGDSGVPFVPQPGLGIAVDVGTTTLVAQLLDLSTGHVLAVRTALNQQARHGGDVMSRVQYAVAGGGAQTLRDDIRKQVGSLISRMLHAAGRSRHAEVASVVLVGNTAMHHLFCGIDCTPLSCYPFEPENAGEQVLRPSELGWAVPAQADIAFLPCIGGFVGSDVLAGIVATGLHESSTLSCLMDLGTNGEIVVGNRNGMLCASTAAGPAFEGARIEMGMRASTGAIWKVTRAAGDKGLRCDVLGNGTAYGICGSGLVDAVAVGLDAGLIKSSGRLARGSGACLPLVDAVKITQADIRELQLAKGAIGAGVRLLLGNLGRTYSDIEAVHLAGAFGNYIDRQSAHRIGMLAFPANRVSAVGNAALHGAKLILCSPVLRSKLSALVSQVKHVSLSADPAFQDVYVEEMIFPAE
jgi:uncharacterized 2Fe-2S/4Fe-4S cluster protein (DUF4445 family)